jgi:hypothetical protein
VIDESLNFSNYRFWFDAQNVHRPQRPRLPRVILTVAHGRLGDVVAFELLNPYKVERVVKQDEDR